MGRNGKQNVLHKGELKKDFLKERSLSEPEIMTGEPEKGLCKTETACNYLHCDDLQYYRKRKPYFFQSSINLFDKDSSANRWLSSYETEYMRCFRDLPYTKMQPLRRPTNLRINVSPFLTGKFVSEPSLVDINYVTEYHKSYPFRKNVQRSQLIRSPTTIKLASDNSKMMSYTEHKSKYIHYTNDAIIHARPPMIKYPNNLKVFNAKDYHIDALSQTYRKEKTNYNNDIIKPIVKVEKMNRRFIDNSRRYYQKDEDAKYYNPEYHCKFVEQPIVRRHAIYPRGNIQRSMENLATATEYDDAFKPFQFMTRSDLSKLHHKKLNNTANVIDLNDKKFVDKECRQSRNNDENNSTYNWNHKPQSNTRIIDRSSGTQRKDKTHNNQMEYPQIITDDKAKKRSVASARNNHSDKDIMALRTQPEYRKALSNYSLRERSPSRANDDQTNNEIPKINEQFLNRNNEVYVRELGHCPDFKIKHSQNRNNSASKKNSSLELHANDNNHQKHAVHFNNESYRPNYELDKQRSYRQYFSPEDTSFVIIGKDTKKEKGSWMKSSWYDAVP